MELVPVTLNGAYMEVNPVALNEHLTLGWKVCEKQAAAEETADQQPVGGKRKSKAQPTGETAADQQPAGVESAEDFQEAAQ